jgi:hypothetical protein
MISIKERINMRTQQCRLDDPQIPLPIPLPPALARDNSAAAERGLFSPKAFISNRI